jgi:hypothetical protein
MRAVVEDLLPNGTDGVIDQMVPRRRPVADVEIDIESLFSEVKSRSEVFSPPPQFCEVQRRSGRSEQTDGPTQKDISSQSE